MNVGDISVAATTEYDVAHSRLVSGYRFSRRRRGGGGDRTAPRAHLRADRRPAHDGGQFVDIALYAGPDGEPFRLGSPRLLLTARRRR